MLKGHSVFSQQPVVRYMITVFNMIFSPSPFNAYGVFFAVSLIISCLPGDVFLVPFAGLTGYCRPIFSGVSFPISAHSVLIRGAPFPTVFLRSEFIF